MVSAGSCSLSGQYFLEQYFLGRKIESLPLLVGVFANFRYLALLCVSSICTHWRLFVS